MKRYYYENWLAKALLAFSSCHTIAIAWFVLSKRSEEKIGQTERNHETIHALQWAEVTMVSGMAMLLLQAIVVFPWYCYLVVPFVYYIWYCLEWFVKLAVCRNSKQAYKAICFEREAYMNENDANYSENRELFSSWLKFVFRFA